MMQVVNHTPITMTKNDGSCGSKRPREDSVSSAAEETGDGDVQVTHEDGLNIQQLMGIMLDNYKRSLLMLSCLGGGQVQGHLDLSMKKSMRPHERRLDLQMKTTIKEREAIFYAVLDINESVLLDMVDIVTADNMDKEFVHALRRVNWIVVAELAKMCGILHNPYNEASTMTHICRVVHEEIQRTKSPKLVFQWLQEMGKKHDELIKEKQIDLLIGSVYESMSCTFQFVKRMMLEKKRRSESAATANESTDCSTSPMATAKKGKEEKQVISRPKELAAVYGNMHGPRKRARRCAPVLRDPDFLIDSPTVSSGQKTMSPRSKSLVGPSFF